MEIVPMVQSLLPEVGSVVMGRIWRTSLNRAIVYLPEYNIWATIHNPAAGMVVGEFQPVVVTARGTIRRFLIVKKFLQFLPKWKKQKRRLLVGNVEVSTDVPLNRNHTCHGRYAMRCHTRHILSAVARQTDLSLKQIYTILGWPDFYVSARSIPSRVPQNVRDALVACVRDMSYMSWRIWSPHILAPSWRMRYRNGLCWAVALVRQFEGLLKLNNMIQRDVFLSVQDVLNHTPSADAQDGVESLIQARNSLRSGITTEDFCPLGSPARLPEAPLYRLRELLVYRVADYTPEVWEGMINAAILQGDGGCPIAASVYWYESYEMVNSDEVYRPNDHEVIIRDDGEATNRLAKVVCGHTMLLTGRGVDQFGRDFLEFQDTTAEEGEDVGIGYVRFGTYPCPVFEIAGLILANTYPA